MSDLGTLGGISSGGSAINLSGVVAGWSNTKVGGRAAFLEQSSKLVDLWSNGKITDLGTLGGPSAEANAINNLGQIVGSSATTTGAADFLDSNGTMTNLGTNNNGNSPTSINGWGVFVDSAAFIYSGGKFQNLNNLISTGSPYQLRDATAINDKGQIVANAYDTATYQTHALLLTPSS